ncbi:MAG: bifunctional precorrin-2 dehydrogenase/sirohydrochlorin ferrochelatase [Deltaproteobacteria bacterium]
MKTKQIGTDLKGLLPIFVRLRGQRVLLVGGGTMATLRARQFLRAGARLTVVSPEASFQLRRLASTRALTWVKREFVSSDVSRRYFMIVGATDDPRVQAAISKAAESKRLLYNVVDAPAHCNFITPAVVERGDLKIAICTLGRSPALSGLMRKEIDSALPRSAVDWLRVLGRLRKSLKRLFPDDLKKQKALLKYLLIKARENQLPNL